jgi:hypothetical protein
VENGALAARHEGLDGVAFPGPPDAAFASVRPGTPSHRVVWLLAEWPAAEQVPTKCWLCHLPPSTTLRRLVRVAKCRWAIEKDYQQMKEELGLGHYAGRGWIGCHHHLTLVMLAHAFLTLETLRRKETSGWTLPLMRRELQYLLRSWIGVCAYCRAKIARFRGS